MKSAWLVVAVYLVAGCALLPAALPQPAYGCSEPEKSGRAAFGASISGLEDAEHYQSIGEYFGRRGDLACAAKAFQTAIRMSPGIWGPHYGLALVLLSNRETSQALSELHIAQTIQPENAIIHVGLGRALMQAGHKDEAIKELKKAVQLSPTSVSARDELAEALLKLGRNKEAIGMLETANANDVLQLDLAIAYSQDAQVSKAIPLLVELIKRYPERAGRALLP